MLCVRCPALGGLRFSQGGIRDLLDFGGKKKTTLTEFKNTDSLL